MRKDKVMPEVLENEYVRSWIEEGILFCSYKTNEEIDLHAAKEIVRSRKEFTKGFSYACLVDVSGVRGITKEARAYLAGEESAEGIVKAAFVVSEAVPRLITNFFLLVNAPKVPSRLFSSFEKARSWLKEDHIF